MNLRCAAFHLGGDPHILDHIAPLADSMQMPLFVSDEDCLRSAKHYYPQVKSTELDDFEFKLQSLSEQYDAFFQCKYWAPHLKALIRDLYGKEMRLVFCPHGQSDKGFQTPFLAPYAQQDRVLLYGKLLFEMLQKLNVEVPSHSYVGNYRLGFYQKYKSFYDALAEREVFCKLDLRKPTLLYAPTWRDLDNNTSFFEFGAGLITQHGGDWNLIVKPHPNLELKDPAGYFMVEKLGKGKPNFVFLDKFLPIYPLLARSDVYLGDASSVGYDFLYFQRPMFCLPTAEPSRIHSCGQVVGVEESIFSFIEKNRHRDFRKEQQALYQYAFVVD